MIKDDKRYKWEVLALLWLAFFINQADRQVFNVVLPLIKADLHLSDVQLGTIALTFNIVFALLIPLAGYIGDIFSRKWIVVVSIAFWSIATMFTGISNGIFMLILTRSIATGGGESFFAPANYALLASYHKNTRALAMSIHQTSYYLGIILSGFVAGYIGQNYGWRNAFYIFGAAGLVLWVVLMVRLKDKTDDKTDEIIEKIRFSEALKVLFKTPTAILLILAFSGMIFIQTGFMTWTPTYLYENFKMSLSQAGFNSVFYTMIFAFVGVIIAGKYSDRLAIKNPGSRLVMQSCGLLCAAPFTVLIGSSKVIFVIYIGLAGFGFSRAFFDANTYTILYDVIHKKYHSTITGIMIMTGFLVGSLAPLILGYLKPILGLSFGISILSVVWALCGVLMFIAYKYYFKKDFAKIH